MVHFPNVYKNQQRVLKPNPNNYLQNINLVKQNFSSLMPLYCCNWVLLNKLFVFHSFRILGQVLYLTKISLFNHKNVSFIENTSIKEHLSLIVNPCTQIILVEYTSDKLTDYQIKLIGISTGQEPLQIMANPISFMLGEGLI